MNNTALEIGQDRIIALVGSIEISSEGSETAEALFAEVFEMGDEVHDTGIGDDNGVIATPAGSAVAHVLFGDERVQETTSKSLKTVPFTIDVVFGVPAGSTPRKHGAYILGQLQARLLAEINRTLPGSSPAAAAIDIRYLGGGSEVFPLNDENPCSRFGFMTDWELDYRNRTTDPTVVA